jgi:hypothetical protein
MKQKFDAVLVAKGPKGAWTHMTVPFDVHKTFGTKARVPVAGTINGHPFRTSIMPNGDGTHYMAITKEMQTGAKARAGQSVHVVMAVDTQTRTVEVPEDLTAALASHPELAETFTAFAYSHRKEFVDWITQAKRPETRARRVEKSLEMIAAKKHPLN